MSQPKLIAAERAVNDEEKVQAALVAVVASGLNQHGQPFLSLRSAAQQFEVSRSKLTSHYNGRKTRLGAHVAQQRLSPAQETVLSDWIKAVGRRGIPMSLVAVSQHASTVLGQPVSESWALRFRA